MSSSADFVAVIDGDLQHDETILREMYRALAKGSANLAIGTRIRDADRGSLSGATGAQRHGRMVLQANCGDGHYRPDERLLHASARDRLASRSAPFARRLQDPCRRDFSAGGDLKIVEVPYRFRKRAAGEFKLTPLVGIDFLGLLVHHATVGWRVRSATCCRRRARLEANSAGTYKRSNRGRRNSSSEKTRAEGKEPLRSARGPGTGCPASASIAVIAPSGRSTFPAWIINDFPSASLTGLGIAGVALAMFLVVLLQPNLVIFDVAGTHVAIGKWIVSHHAVPHTEPFSWWMVGQPWQASEWLSESGQWISSLTRSDGADLSSLRRSRYGHNSDHWSHGGSQTRGTPIAEHHRAECVRADQHSERPPRPVCVAARCGLGRGLVIARDRNRAPPFWLVIIMALWVNMHGSFIVGLFLLVPFCGRGRHLRVGGQAATDPFELGLVRRRSARGGARQSVRFRRILHSPFVW